MSSIVRNRPKLNINIVRLRKLKIITFVIIYKQYDALNWKNNTW